MESCSSWWDQFRQLSWEQVFRLINWKKTMRNKGRGQSRKKFNHYYTFWKGRCVYFDFFKREKLFFQSWSEWCQKLKENRLWIITLLFFYFNPFPNLLYWTEWWSPSPPDTWQVKTASFPLMVLIIITWTKPEQLGCDPYQNPVKC